MMSDLFSSLDGARFMSAWALTLLVFFMYFSKSYNTQLVKWVYHLVSMVLMGNKFRFFMKLNTMVFSLIMIWNLLGLAPVVYSESCHLWVGASMGLTIWGMFLISGWLYNVKYSAASLVPSGSPMVLAPMLVLIETISALIRPLTLTVRLVANITAGHIVLGLIVASMSSISVSMLFTFMVSTGYTVFEVFVGVIQAYIFTLLVSMYSLEHP